MTDLEESTTTPSTQTQLAEESTAPVPSNTALEEPEETFEEPVSKLPTTTNFEPCKNSFFNKRTDEFITAAKSGKFKIFNAKYRYDEDYEGKPKFIVNNFLNGLVNQLEDKRKYLFVVFRAECTDGKYTISSTWMTNCTLPMEEIVPDKYDDFEWTICDKLEELDVIDLFQDKSGDNTMITYLH